MVRVTRETQEYGTIYVVGYRHSQVIFTPSSDGEGRHYYDSVGEARDDYDHALSVVYCDSMDN